MNRFAAIVFVIVLGSIPLPGLSAEEDAQAKIALGWSSYIGEDWPAAERAFRQAIDLDPSLAEAYRGLAETLLRQGRPEAAEQAILEGIPHLPSDTSTLSPFAEILARNEETRAGAIQIYRLLLGQAPGDRGTRLDLARTLAWTGHHREAIEECRRVHDGATDADIRYQARLLEAQVQSWRGNAKKSLPAFRALAAERPEDPEPRLGIANSLAWTGRTRTAAEEYESILADFPSPEAWVGLGDISRWGGRYSQAEADYLRALDLRPDDSRARAALASNRRESSIHLSFVPARFRDSTDWERDSFPLFVDFLRKRPVSLRTGVAWIRYQQRDGQEVDRTSVPVQAFWKPGPRFSGAAGIARNEYSEGPDSTSYFLHAFFAPGDDLVRFRVGFDHYDMIDNFEPFTENFYNQPESIDVARLGIDLDELWGGLLLQFSGRLTWNSNLAWADISDGNERWTAFSRLAYRLPGRDRVSLFGQFYYQNVAMPTPLYFDPKNFQSYGVGARWEGERAGYFRFLLDGSVDYFPREAENFGGQLHGYAEWDLTEHFSLRVTGNYLSSPEERGTTGDRYRATYLGLKLVFRFPSRQGGGEPRRSE